LKIQVKQIQLRCGEENAKALFSAGTRGEPLTEPHQKSKDGALFVRHSRFHTPFLKNSFSGSSAV
jgi:hypothetical protein